MVRAEYDIPTKTTSLLLDGDGENIVQETMLIVRGVYDTIREHHGEKNANLFKQIFAQGMLDGTLMPGEWEPEHDVIRKIRNAQREFESSTEEKEME